MYIVKKDANSQHQVDEKTQSYPWAYNFVAS
jgi:hypothetical protein